MISVFLVPQQRVPSDDGMLRLVSGTVDSYELSSAHGPGRLTIFVTMSLQFDGAAMAWKSGVNERFVTAHLDQDNGPILLAFVTSP